MATEIRTGLDLLLSNPHHQKLIGDHIGYLGHEASVTDVLEPGHMALHRITGSRLKCLFGPQHGFNTLDQDNMIETGHTIHPVLHIPVYSLYSETRIPTTDMLKGLDTLIIDLQDVGTRVYTYIWTLWLCMKACSKLNIRVIVTDRPNPAGGLLMEGNLPLPEWYSFVCMARLPMRHGMTIGEIALLFQTELEGTIDLHIISMSGWSREMLWNHTGRLWVNPSPNLATPESTLVYPGSVLLEGTILSEGRGTTRSLEMAGHPDLEPYKLLPDLEKEFKQAGLSGFVLRPVVFKPTFDKFTGQPCGGYQIHPTQPEIFRPWSTLQHFLKFIYHRCQFSDFWNRDPYEYQTDGLAIDYINGDPDIRKWIERDGSSNELLELERHHQDVFEEKRNNVLIYFHD